MLTLKPSKCSFSASKIEFLGYMISNGEMRPGRAKIRSIAEYPKPTNVHEIRSFFGLTGFFRRFVKNYAVHAEPLTNWTLKK